MSMCQMYRRLVTGGRTIALVAINASSLSVTTTIKSLLEYNLHLLERAYVILLLLLAEENILQ